MPPTLAFAAPTRSGIPQGTRITVERTAPHRTTLSLPDGRVIAVALDDSPVPVVARWWRAGVSSPTLLRLAVLAELRERLADPTDSLTLDLAPIAEG